MVVAGENFLRQIYAWLFNYLLWSQFFYSFYCTCRTIIKVNERLIILFMLMLLGFNIQLQRFAVPVKIYRVAVYGILGFGWKVNRYYVFARKPALSGCNLNIAIGGSNHQATEKDMPVRKIIEKIFLPSPIDLTIPCFKYCFKRLQSLFILTRYLIITFALIHIYAQ